MRPAKSKLKRSVLRDFRDHVSSGKADFYARYRMDFVMGTREGPWLTDIDGKKKLYNLHCNGGVFNLGHRNRELIELLKDAFDTYDIGNHHLMSETRASLAASIAESMPGDLEYTIFGSGGGEAVDLAIKVARGYTKRTGIVSMKGGYHGHTGLAVMTGDDQYRRPFGLTSDGYSQVPLGDLEALETALRLGPAAVIMESIPATSGVVILRPDYVRAIRQLTEKAGVLLIMDEVQTGFGRTGKLWGFEHYGIIPDIVVLGKGMSGGLYPISATVIRKDLEKVFHKDPFAHISTFGGAEPGAVVAKRVLEICSNEEFLQNVNRLSKSLADQCSALIDKHNGFFRALRRRGLMMGIELSSQLAGPVLTKTAYDNDLLLVYANNNTSVVQFLPSLTMPDTDIEIIIPALDRALSSARRLTRAVGLQRNIKNRFAR